MTVRLTCRFCSVGLLFVLCPRQTILQAAKWEPIWTGHCAADFFPARWFMGVNEL